MNRREWDRRAFDAAQAATLILSWMTAYQLLHRVAGLQRRQRVLVQEAGTVSQALLTLGKMAELEVWGTVWGEHTGLVRDLGATPIDYQRGDFARVLPGRFDIVFDGIGEDGYRRSFAGSSRYWSIYGINLRGPLPPGVEVQGLADDLAAAGAAFKENWAKLLAAGSLKP